jgi:hypothetical protein
MPGPKVEFEFTEEEQTFAPGDGVAVEARSSMVLVRSK